MLRRLFLFLQFVFLLCFFSCADNLPPNLLGTLTLSSHEANLGDTLEIIGSGFPTQRKAHVMLRGQLHRPGQRNETIELESQAVTKSSRSLEWAVQSQITNRICGPLQHAIHTTFRGDIYIAFEPIDARTPALAGHLPSVIVDFCTHSSAHLTSSNAYKESLAAIQFLGIQLTYKNNGVFVEKTEQRSVAERYGIKAGDELLELDGHRILSTVDLIPSAEHTSNLILKRDEIPQPLGVQIPLDGYRKKVPYSVWVLWVAIASIVLSIYLLNKPISNLEWKCIKQLSIEKFSYFSLKRWFFPNEDDATVRIEWNVTMLSVWLLMTFLGISILSLYSNFDILFLLVFFVLSSALVQWALQKESNWTRWFRPWVQRVWFASVSFICIFGLSGSFRLYDIVSMQSGLPWEWNIFQGFGGLAATTSLIFILVQHIALLEKNKEPTSARWYFGWAYVAMLSGLVVLFFIGGWAIPWIHTQEQQSWWGWQALGSLFFIGKAWALLMIARMIVKLNTLHSNSVDLKLHWKYSIVVPVIALLWTGRSLLWPVPSELLATIRWVTCVSVVLVSFLVLFRCKVIHSNMLRIKQAM